jgi:hypothetical protein
MLPPARSRGIEVDPQHDGIARLRLDFEPADALKFVGNAKQARLRGEPTTA